MAQANKPPQTPDPLEGLSREAREHLENIKGELDEAEKDQDALEQLGLDTSRNRERIEWGRKAVEVIAKRLKERKI